MALDEQLVITCIRHGVTEGNERKAYIGWTDQPLAEQGKVQLMNCREYYPHSPDLVVGSDLQRCRETAAILYPNIPYIPMKEWRELHFGEWEGKTHDELQERSTYQSWLNDPFQIPVENGERFDEFSERIWQAWDLSVAKLLACNGKHLVIVSHGGVLKRLASAFSAEKKQFWDWHFSPGEGGQWIHTIQTARSKKQCISYLAVPLMENENG
ncbi:histidine phosphatase family protein [Priestia abyssalis]|uniref:histidine phosphatase family protein n=1 Tax=Priestia abyssalis TaxID=1221450 RepID=UPI000995CF1B|nr:histidine phosphatase family protein [Priestia abyssalis]